MKEPRTATDTTCTGVRKSWGKSCLIVQPKSKKIWKHFFIWQKMKKYFQMKIYFFLMKTIFSYFHFLKFYFLFCWNLFFSSKIFELGKKLDIQVDVKFPQESIAGIFRRIWAVLTEIEAKKLRQVHFFNILRSICCWAYQIQIDFVDLLYSVNTVRRVQCHVATCETVLRHEGEPAVLSIRVM